MEKTVKKRKSPFIKKVLPCVKGYWGATIITPFLMIGEVALEVLIPMLMAAIVDGCLNRNADFKLKEIIVDLFGEAILTDYTRMLLIFGSVMVLASLLSLFFGAMAARTAAIASMGFGKNLRMKLFKKIQAFSFANTDKFSTASLIMRMTTDVTNMQNVFGQLIRICVRAPLMMILAAVMAFQVDSQLCFVFIFAIPLLAVILYILVKVAYPRFRAMLKAADKMNLTVQENLTNFRVVKAYVREDFEKNKYNEANTSLLKMQVRAQKLFAFMNPLQLLVLWTCAIIIWMLGGTKVVMGGLGTGELTSLISYNQMVLSSLTMVAFIIMTLSMTRASSTRINEVLDEEIDIVEAEGAHEKIQSGSIDFDDVCFSYSKDPDNLTLRNINLHIKAGETIGLVGGTGDGKTTLVQLIPRFYDVLSGSIKIDGKDVRDLSLVDLRDSISMELQKNNLFSGSIKDNLRWGNENATDDEIIEAAKAACAHEFIIKRPEGYDADLGQGGVNVSGGQKQRLCIARALLKKPYILILDDSTSAVDSTTEQSIQKALRSLTSMTKIIIAQRISSVKDADKIIVMDKGTISDVGTHDELMARSDIYRDIYNSQMEGK